MKQRIIQFSPKCNYHEPRAFFFTFNNAKLTGLRTSEVAATLVAFKVGSWRYAWQHTLFLHALDTILQCFRASNVCFTNQFEIPNVLCNYYCGFHFV